MPTPRKNPPVVPLVEARDTLSATVARLAAEGEEAQPVVVGRHRRPEAVIVAYELWEALTDAVEEHHTHRENRVARRRIG